MGFFFSKSAHSSNNSNLVIFLENEVIVGCNSYFTVAKSHTETDTSVCRCQKSSSSYILLPNSECGTDTTTTGLTYKIPWKIEISHEEWEHYYLHPTVLVHTAANTPFWFPRITHHKNGLNDQNWSIEPSVWSYNLGKIIWTFWQFCRSVYNLLLYVLRDP